MPMTGPDIQIRMLWERWLQQELALIWPRVRFEDPPTTELAKLHAKISEALKQCVEQPRDRPVTDAVVHYWLFLAGERIAETYKYGFYREVDALRYYAFDKKNMDFEKAMALPEQALAAMFCDILRPFSNERKSPIAINA